MHKTVSASIGSALLTVEEGAYARLDAYLKAIRAHFAATPDADEIVSDIEDRIAEELSEALSARKKVVLMKDVEAVIRSMGTVEDFKAFEGETKEQGGEAGKTEDESGSWKHVRLYRDADDQIIGGVCSGIAKYFGIDPLLVRLAFGLSLLAGGFGAVLYILLWVLLPEARTTAQKVEMTGGRVTLQAIQERIDEHLPPERRRSVLRKILAVPVVIVGGALRVVGSVLRFVLPLLARLAGVVLLLAAAFAIAAATTAAFSVLLNPASPYIGLPLRDILGQPVFVILTSCIYFLALMPLMLILILAASLVSLRVVATWPAVGGLFGAWMVVLVVAGVVGFTAAPAAQTQIELVTQARRAEVVTPHPELSGFENIVLLGDVSATINDDPRLADGAAFMVRERATERTRGTASLNVSEGTLYINTLRPDDRCMIFCDRQRVHVDITLPRLAALEAHGISRADVLLSTGASLLLAATDASRVEALVRTGTLTARMADVARVALRGSGTTLTAEAHDASRLDAGDFSVRDATITLTDVARADVTASGALRGTLSDASRLSYENRPATVEVETSDVARVDGPEEDLPQWDEDLDAQENLR